MNQTSLQTLHENFTQVCDQLWEGIIKNSPLFLWGLATCILVYGYELFNFSLSIDEEVALAYGSHNGYVLQRWGLLALYRLFVPLTFLPFFNAIYTCILLSLSACLMVRVLSFKNMESRVFVIMFCAFPQFAYQMEFLFQSPYIAFGYLFCVASYMGFRKVLQGQYWYAPISIALLTLATGIYQSLILTVPLLFALHLLVRLTDKDLAPLSFKEVLGETWKCLLMLACSLVAYLVLSKIFTASIDTSYLTNQIGWRNSPLLVSLRRVKDALLVHLHGKAYYGERLYVLVYIPLLCCLPTLLRRYHGVERLWTLAVLFAMPILPFTQIICFGTHVPVRTLLGQSILLAGMLALTVRLVRIPKVIVAAVVLICVLISSAHVSRLFFQDSLRWRADMSLATQILTRLYSEPEYIHGKHKIFVYGAPDLPPLPRLKRSEVFGSSFFTHDGGNLFRINTFLSTQGLAKFDYPTHEEVAAIKPLLKDKPTWPHPQSFFRVGDVWVFKMGNKPEDN